MLSVSVISHGHGNMVCKLVDQLLKFHEVDRVIVTLNIPETIFLPTDDRVFIIQNILPKGFASNNNQAFDYCISKYFCVINPDVIVGENPFSEMVSTIENHRATICAPRIINSSGEQDDSIRRFPTPIRLARKALGRPVCSFSVSKVSKTFHADWVAGMFMLFTRDGYSQLSGFDEGFFLYYEDVDICVRAWKRDMKVIVCPTVSVIHNAQRDSHRKLRYMYWHISSLARFFLKHLGRLPRVA